MLGEGDQGTTIGEGNKGTTIGEGNQGTTIGEGPGYDNRGGDQCLYIVHFG